MQVRPSANPRAPVTPLRTAATSAARTPAPAATSEQVTPGWARSLEDNQMVIRQRPAALGHISGTTEEKAQEWEEEDVGISSMFFRAVFAAVSVWY